MNERVNDLDNELLWQGHSLTNSCTDKGQLLNKGINERMNELYNEFYCQCTDELITLPAWDLLGAKTKRPRTPLLERTASNSNSGWPPPAAASGEAASAVGWVPINTNKQGPCGCQHRPTNLPGFFIQYRAGGISWVKGSVCLF